MLSNCCPIQLYLCKDKIFVNLADMSGCEQHISVFPDYLFSAVFGDISVDQGVDSSVDLISVIGVQTERHTIYRVTVRALGTYTLV